MAHLRNTPTQHTLISLEARKSFSLGLWIKDFLGHALDITGSSLRLVVRKTIPVTDFGDSENLIVSSLAFLQEPGQGYARFDVQASELDHAPGEYLFAIVLVSSGYSSVIVEGTIDISANTEFSSLSESFTPGINPPQQLDVLLREQAAVTVYAGQALAPGTLSFTTADKDALDALVTQGWDVLANRPSLGSAAFVNVEDVALPPGGSPTAALLKASAADYDTHWAQIATGGTGLDATGQPAGAQPTATGSDTWDWEVPVPAVASVNGETGVVDLDSDDITEGAANLYTTAIQQAILSAFSNPPSYTDLEDQPTLGTIATHAEADYHAVGDIVPNTDVPRATELRGTSRGTAAPAGGVDGDQYRQYTA